MFLDISIFNANSIDADKTPRFATAFLGLYRLQMFILLEAGHKWVKWQSRKEIEFKPMKCLNFQ